jgi:hypothetical protein
VTQGAVIGLLLSFIHLVKYENSQYYFYEPNGPYSNTAWDIDISNNEVLVAGGALTFQYGPTFQLKRSLHL